MASIISEYIAQRMSVLDLKIELSRLRSEYNRLTGRNLFIYASDFNKGKQGIDVSLMQDDFYMIQDILRESDKRQIDIYLETPGGSGEAAEEIARFLHSKFEEVNFVIAGEAKSAGTILAMCANNIYMCSTGSLGPIDAQVRIGRSVVSAYDYKTWVDERREEAKTNGKLNPFDALLISQISPGEIYGIMNSLQFAQDLVKEWLPKYKFKNWVITETRGIPVTQEMKEERANDISEKLCNHMDWHTHRRSLKIEDLKEELKIEDIDDTPALADVVYRIKTVIRLIFDTCTDFKLYFWEDCELARSANVASTPFNNPPAHGTPKNIEVVEFGVPCPKCGKEHKVKGYANLTSSDIKRLSLQVNPLVKDNDLLVCDTPGCGFTIDLKPIKNMFENQFKKKVTLK
ncbi:MAG: ATP-dependent Clp protease proteolytic subunit [Bacteroidales bacterium]|nr:ATP-dependent Clp protease proteolytic subunit [Bacteroidales bacterium]